MCGIGGIFSKNPVNNQALNQSLEFINSKQKHRGPDDNGTWISQSTNFSLGFCHTRLSIIGLDDGKQPITNGLGYSITFNGEIYNYKQLKNELKDYNFQTHTDTEVILAAYLEWGEKCLDRLRGMFAFTIWDPKKEQLFFARDRFGIKPFQYFFDNEQFIFASETKAITAFVPELEINKKALREYFAYQFTLNGHTLFDGVKSLPPAHYGVLTRDMNLTFTKYWEVHYNLEWRYRDEYFVDAIREALNDSVQAHLESDVEVGAYISGGLDSSIVGSIARSRTNQSRFLGFNGGFDEGESFDESSFAKDVCNKNNLDLITQNFMEQDFVESIEKVIYHLDQPTAGPGAFPQYMISQTAAKHVKTVLGGQGGDEIFGGYTRYLIAYFEQCIRGAIDGTMNSGNFVVSYESIIPNLKSLKNYKPLIKEFWSNGLFSERDERYFRLVNRSNTMGNLVNWAEIDSDPLPDFQNIFWGKNVKPESYFDLMTHFDFKTLLPALLHVEDRMSMAHSLESRVPLLDTKIVELAATIPADIKFKNGELKRLLKICFKDLLPKSLVEREDKMGFPVPLNNWLQKKGITFEYVHSTLTSQKAKERFYINSGADIANKIETEGKFSRNLWALLSLELWQKSFFDNHSNERRSIG